jgi:hypothetical protein
MALEIKARTNQSDKDVRNPEGTAIVLAVTTVIKLMFISMWCA